MTFWCSKLINVYLDYHPIQCSHNRRLLCMFDTSQGVQIGLEDQVQIADGEFDKLVRDMDKN